MKKLGKVLLIVIGVLVVLLVAAVSLTIGWRPILGPRARALTAKQYNATPERPARGQYLANGVSGCMFCHSDHDWSKREEPVLPGRLGVGEVMPLLDLPGRIVAPNLTPDAETGAGTWSDDQLARAIREGIGHDGRTLFPMMPYERFRSMSDEDLASIIVYLRSLPAVKNPLPTTDIIFPVKYLIRSAPQPVERSVSSPNSSDRVAWGKYLTTIAGCEDCHTPNEHGQVVPGMAFAGGMYFATAKSGAAGANITPDASGISYYDEDLFLQVFHAGYVKARPLNSMMPFGFYGHMNDDDLKAIFAFLKTVPPVKHRVDNSLPPTLCKLCKQKHGGGDQN